MDRWLLQEQLGPLLFGIAAFTAVSLSVGVVFELVRRVAESGLPLLAAVKVLLLRLPSFLVLSFPMATLMATLLAYSRLSGSSELTALRSVGGVHVAWCWPPWPFRWRWCPSSCASLNRWVSGSMPDFRMCCG